jgi:hypothetical protein
VRIRSGRFIAGLLLLVAIGWGCYSSIAPTAVIDPGALDSGLPITNPPDAGDACVPRKPWEGPGITGVLPLGGNNGLVISGDRYFMAEVDLSGGDADDPNLGNVTRWHESGFLKDLWSSAPPVLGLKPWDDPGVTAAYIDKLSGDQIIISRFRRWVYDGTQWPAAGNIVDDWIIADAGPQALDGQAPWEGPGVTAGYYTPAGDLFYAISQNRGWLRLTDDPDPKNWTWTVDGGFALASSTDWNSAPAISGQHLYDGPGVTTAYYVGPKLFVVSVDRMWSWDGASWTAMGLIKDLPGWSSAPTAGCGG